VNYRFVLIELGADFQFCTHVVQVSHREKVVLSKHARSATQPVARQRPRPDAEIVGGKVLF
jgi:hypothetical protein